MSSSSADLTPQQIALRAVRDRYERGALDYDTFRDAFERLLKTEDPATCQRIVDELPNAPMDVLAALDRTASPPAAIPVPRRTPRLPNRRTFFTLMGEIKRTSKPWKMGTHTNGFALMGSINLDLTLAALPQNGSLNIAVLMGEVRLTVPANADVTVHAFTLMGETRALDEHTAGIFAYAHDDGDDVPAAQHHLDIHVFVLMGEVRVQRNAATTALAHM